MALDIRPYTKTPAQVDAVMLTRENLASVADWAHSDVDTATGSIRLLVHTLEGSLYARPGDWIVRGVAGEFHPVRADIFARTYRPVEL